MVYATFAHYFPHFFFLQTQSSFQFPFFSLLPEMLPMCRRLPKTPIGNFRTAVRLVSESVSKLSACYPVIL